MLDSHLRPAQRISEISVANDLGVSRTLAHEAVRRLEQEGWLILVPRQGYYVAAAAAPVEQPIQSSKESVKDLAQICVVEE